MMKTIAALLSGLLFIILFPGCKKNTSCNAGSGGDVTLVLKPEHHGIPITGSTNYRDSAFIKFNAVDFPGPNPANYDVIVAGNVGENFVNVPGLKCGQYFIMMAGFDTSSTWHIRVLGGLAVNYSETSGSKTFVIAVTE